MDPLERIWKEALQRYEDTLPPKRIKKMLLTPDLESLLERTKLLQSRYSGRPIIRALERAQPFLNTIQSFSEVVKVFLQSDPGIFALVWGSIWFVLEVSPCSRAASLRNALVEYYAEVIGICQDAVSFCSHRSLSNLFIKRFDSSYEENTRRRVEQLKISTIWVDQEASVISSQLIRQELLRGFQDLRLDLRQQPKMHILQHPFHNLPYTRNLHFHARQVELSRLEKDLQPGVLPGKLLVVGLHGTGGVGKTEIALEYAYRYQKYYDAVLWVTAETSVKLSGSFSSLSGQLGIVDQSVQSSHQRCEELKRWLGATSQRSSRPCRWLIIYDNVETSTSLQPFWPTGSHGAVILTSRNPAVSRHLGGPTAAIEVLPFSASEGQKFLLRLGTDRENAASQEERTAAEAIADAVGNLPLAVFLTGSYIYSAGLSLTQFLTAQPHFERTFLFDDQVYSQYVGNYEQSLDKTWSLANFTANGNPGFVLMSNRLDQAISALMGRSLVTRKQGADCISCHRLVQSAVLFYMPRDQRVVAFNKLQFYLNGAFPQQGDGEPLHSQWKRCEEFSSHVLALLDTYKWVKDDVQSPILLCEITSRCAWFYFERGDMSIAHKLASDAILICEKALLLSNHPGYSEWYVKDQLGHLYNVRASVAYETGKTGDALNLHSKIKSMRLANMREGNLDDKWLAAADGNLAVSLMAEGKPEIALPLVLSLLERPDMGPNEDVYLNNACVCHMLLGDYVNALKYGSKAMAAVRRLRGEESAQMAIYLFYAGNIYQKQGRVGEAFDALSKCLRLRRTLMPTHSYTGLTLHKIGTIVQERGDVALSM
ncbi:uncharacterized protein BDZ99DRAFT_397743 [Mytilinidion resinicola]|uniref:NB-ARC domain-containing protein n=1 Tax=Mytilinidion resinicola TaxID=574789 RepID=A0A6A6Y718_9PEZI|nr:uncharacterized protein BDZ99DRAFT_397743 [Mytilinidion resinicola]KAF2804621.1 hypothetical protein BDZ99DRAFT_397743 [Mytilinidion resinicola]